MDAPKPEITFMPPDGVVPPHMIEVAAEAVVRAMESYLADPVDNRVRIGSVLISKGRAVAGEVDLHDVVEIALEEIFFHHHVYLSTGCMHGDHDYCQAKLAGTAGWPKRAAECKFCPAKCQCLCHANGNAGQIVKGA